MTTKPNFNSLLIDGDILVYRIGFTSEDVDEGIAIWRLDQLINSICSFINPKDEVKIFLSETERTNFRYSISDTYKKSRRNKPQPYHFYSLREHLFDNWQAICDPGQEADDGLGICQTSSMKEGKATVIASVDKDLLQIRGWHYNFVKETLREVSETEATRWFYLQVLGGDSSDDVRGVPKIGEKRALRLLEGCETEEEMWNTTKQTYEKAFGKEKAMEELLRNGKLLRIRRYPDEIWSPNILDIKKPEALLGAVELLGKEEEVDSKGES